VSESPSLLVYGPLALVPGLLWLAYFYRLDKYEPEPAWLLARTFLLGGLTTIPAFLLEKTLIELWVDGPVASLAALPHHTLVWVAFLIIAPVEETLKFLATYTSVSNSPEYDEPMDGVVYAAAAALGFATVENLWYMGTSGVTVLVGRGLFSCMLHATASGILGYAWSQVRFFDKPLSRLLLAWVGAVAAHAVFDIVAFGHEGNAILKLGLVLVIIDAALTARIARARRHSPFRPEDEEDEEPEVA